MIAMLRKIFIIKHWVNFCKISTKFRTIVDVLVLFLNLSRGLESTI